MFGLLGGKGLYRGAPSMARFLKDEYEVKHEDGTAVTWKSFQVSHLWRTCYDVSRKATPCLRARKY